MEIPKLTAPPNFTYIEDCLSRCTTPISRPSWSFFPNLLLGAILNISGEKFDDQLLAYFHSNNIQVNNFSFPSESVGSDIVELEERVKRVLETTMSLTLNASSFTLSRESSHTGVLIVGSPHNCFDCLVIACMRRLQDWSLISILAEFRSLQGPLQKRSPYAEHFIEYFDEKIIDTTHLPDFIAIHRSMLKEEEAVLSISDKVVAEQCKTLFFSPPNKLLTSPNQYSHLSIVDDKEED